MEDLHGEHTSKLASQDVISTMPDNVISYIMNRLPIRDAVRTSILARNWRLKWTLLTRIDLDMETCQYFVTPGPEGQRFYDSKIISRLLFDIKGPITKFCLEILSHKLLHVEDVNHWVLFLSRKGIFEFHFLNTINDPPFKLPTHLFSCLELRYVALYNCYLHFPHTFRGFPNLLRLEMYYVRFDIGKCEEFIRGCPLLMILDIGLLDPICKINAGDIEKLENLIKLSLPLCMIEHMVMTTSRIFQLLGFLPKLEDLLVDLSRCKFIVEPVANIPLSTAFHCLKTLHLFGIDFGNGTMLSYAVEMILAPPNLQTLYITAMDQDEFPSPVLDFLKIDCSRMKQLQLRRLDVLNLIGSDEEVCLIKWLLAYSPFLEEIRIRSSPILDSDEKLMFAKELLNLDRASPLATVDFC